MWREDNQTAEDAMSDSEAQHDTKYYLSRRAVDMIINVDRKHCPPLQSVPVYCEEWRSWVRIYVPISCPARGRSSQTWEGSRGRS